MDWKTALANSFLTFIAVVVGVRYFSPDTVQQLNSFQKQIVERIQEVSNHIQDLSSSERKNNTFGKLKTPSSSIFPTEISQSSGITEINKSLQAINQSLEDIFESLQRLEDTKENRFPSMPADRVTEKNQVLKQSKPIGPTAWMEELPENTRTKVDAIFREQRDSLSAQRPMGLPSDPQALKELMEKNDQDLKLKLKAVLRDDEYQKFLDSNPKRTRPQSLPKISPTN
jgi:hypothetical protein